MVTAARLPRLRDDGGLSFVVLGVEDAVRDVMGFQHLGEPFGGLDGGRTDQHRTSGLVDGFDFLGDGLELGQLCLVDLVGHIQTAVVALVIGAVVDGDFVVVLLRERAGERDARVSRGRRFSRPDCQTWSDIRRWWAG